MTIAKLQLIRRLLLGMRRALSEVIDLVEAELRARGVPLHGQPISSSDGSSRLT